MLTPPSSPPHSPRYLTVAECAERIGVSTRTIWQRIAAAEIGVVRFGRRTVRVSEDELQRFIDAAKTRGDS